MREEGKGGGEKKGVEKRRKGRGGDWKEEKEE